jgi:hypothetical protein
MRQSPDARQVVDRHDLDVGAPDGALHIDRAEEVPAHPAETVDANSDCHE